MKKVSILFFVCICVHFVLYKAFSANYSFSWDHNEFFITYFNLMKAELANGRIPFWNSKMYFGVPLLLMGSIDLKIIPFLSFLSTLDAMVLQPSFYWLLTGVSFFHLSRKLLNFDFNSALLGSFFWTFNAFFCWYLYDSALMAPYFWMPFFIVVIEHYRDQLWKAIPFLSLGLMDVMATARYDCIEFSFIGIFVFFLVYLSHELQLSKQRLFIGLLKRASVFLTSLGIAIACIWPIFIEHISQVLSSSRFNSGKEGYLYKTDWFTFLQGIPKFNRLGGAPGGVDEGYVGFAVVVVILFGLFLSNKKRKTWIYFSIASIFMFFMVDFKWLGFHPYIDFIKELPGHSGLRYSHRFLPLFFLFLSIVVMNSWDGWFTPVKSRWKKVLQVGFAVFVIIWSLKFARGLYRDNAHQLSLWLPQMQVITLLIINSVLIFLNLIIRNKAVATYLMVAVIFISSFFVNWIINGYDPTNYFRVRANSEDQMKIVNFLKQHDPSNQYRIYDKHDLVMGLATLLPRNGLAMTEGYLPILSAQFSAFNGTLLDSSPDLAAMGLASVKYYLLNKTEAGMNKVGSNWFEETDRFVKVFENNNDVIFEGKHPLPRFRLATQYHVIDGKSSSEVAKMAKLKYRQDPQEYFNFAYVESKELMSSDEAELDDEVFLNVKASHNDMHLIEVASKSGGLLVWTDHFLPKYWSAYVDGVKVSLLKVDGYFAAARVGPGRHNVEFRYAIPLVEKLVSLVGLFILIVLTLGVYKAHRRSN